MRRSIPISRQHIVCRVRINTIPEFVRRASLLVPNPKVGCATLLYMPLISPVPDNGENDSISHEFVLCLTT